jgi:hypothetical protein
MTEKEFAAEVVESRKKLMLHARKFRKPDSPRGTGVRRKVTPARIMKAIPGSAGIVSVISKRLGCDRSTLHWKLKHNTGPDWDAVREALRVERDTILDEAEESIHYCIKQRKDKAVSSLNARWVLEKKGAHRGYQNKSEITLQGGDRPIKLQSTIVDISKLPLSLRKQILESLESDSSGVTQESPDSDGESTVTNSGRSKKK